MTPSLISSRIPQRSTKTPSLLERLRPSPPSSNLSRATRRTSCSASRIEGDGLREQRSSGSSKRRLRAEGDLEPVRHVVAEGSSGWVAVPELEVAGVSGLDAGECISAHIELLAGCTEAVEEDRRSDTRDRGRDAADSLTEGLICGARSVEEEAGLV